MRSAMAAISLAIASLVFVQDAGAASAACRRLESQLATGSPARGRYSVYALRQRAELEKARGQLGRCSFFGTDCQSLKSTIGRMQRNLAKLEGRAGGGASSRERARILAALDANGCREEGPQKQMVVRKMEKPSLLSAFFGDGAGRQRKWPRQGLDVRVASLNDEPWNSNRLSRQRLREDGRMNEYRGNDGSEVAGRQLGEQFGGSTYQVMCVRISDGSYFPISPASNRSNLDRDRNNCQAMCHGSEVSLYYKRLDEDDADAMVSVETGERYGELATAYRYREQTSPGCNGDRNAALAARADVKTIDFEFPVPMPKPGSDKTIPLWVGAAEAAVATPPPGQRTVRVVGPAFLPDPPAAAGPPVQGQIPAL